MQSVRKVSALILSMLVMLSSMSFTLNVHLCMGQIDNIALFKEAKACEMATQVTPCAKEQHKEGHNHQISKKGCCEDHSIFIERQDEITKTASVAMPDVAFVAVLYVVVAYLSAQSSVDTDSYKAYSPPLIERDIPVLIQSFLI